MPTLEAWSRSTAETLSVNRWPVVLAAASTAAGVAVGALLGFAPQLLGAVGLAIGAANLAWLEWRRRRMEIDDPWGAAATAGHFIVVAVVAFGLMQLVPYGRDHSNPPITGEPDWASERTRDLMVAACYDCHSNEVEWPWYANIAPVSWAAQAHIDDGRDAVNYSEFTTSRSEAHETLEVILDGSMPPGYFTRFGLHPEASLSEAELAELVEGIRSTPGLSGRDRDRDDD